MDLSAAELLFIAAASVVAGGVNAVAGGGTLIAFPALTLTGISTVEANITTTIALTPGYLGGTVAQRDDLSGQRRRVVALVPGCVIGGAIGAGLLAITSESLFRDLVPWLLFLACGLLAAQDRIRAVVERRAQRRPTTAARRDVPVASIVAVSIAAIYGGYFGGALGIVLLAVLGVTLDDEMRRINALKQLLSLVTNVAASVLLLFSGKVPWEAAAVMAVGSLVGGAVGGRVARRLDASVFRVIVIAIGMAVAIVYLVKR